MNKCIFLLSFLFVGCGGESDSNVSNEVLGRWKTGCFTDDVIDYWVTSEYIFSDSEIERIGFIYEDENCTLGISGTNGGPVVKKGEYFFLDTVLTSEGLNADIYGTYFLSRDESEISELGVYIEGNVLYFVFENAEGYYVNFEHPYYNNNE